MRSVTFVTGNKRKLAEMQAACQQFSIRVEQLEMDIDEIQHHDPIIIAQHKAAEAFHQAGKPVVVTDTSWSIPALGGFPGGYMKDVSAWFSPADFINLMAGKTNRRVSFTETVVYQDDATQKIFSETYLGLIVEVPRGTGESIEEVAEFDGHTLGERREDGTFSHDPKDYVWHQFAEWYTRDK